MTFLFRDEKKKKKIPWVYCFILFGKPISVRTRFETIRNHSTFINSISNGLCYGSRNHLMIFRPLNVIAGDVKKRSAHKSSIG